MKLHKLYGKSHGVLYVFMVYGRPEKRLILYLILYEIVKNKANYLYKAIEIE